MSETSSESEPTDPKLEQQPLMGELDLADEELSEKHEAAEALRVAYEGWLERRGIEPASIPHLSMDRRAFDLLRNVGADTINYALSIYGIPLGELYAWIEVGHDNPNLMKVYEEDFGTVIGRAHIAADFQNPDSNPDNPPAPDSPGAVVIVDIKETLALSGQGLLGFTQKLMAGEITDPFSGSNGDVGVRAGEVASGQKDAYVWTVSPLTKSVELTIAFPSMYDSVCVVSGQRREAANGKPGMAQIENPAVLLKIDGENLKELQRIYGRLYDKPDFMVSEYQQKARDELFNSHLKWLISDAAAHNYSDEMDVQQHLQERALPR